MLLVQAGVNEAGGPTDEMESCRTLQYPASTRTEPAPPSRRELVRWTVLMLVSCVRLARAAHS